MSPAPPPRRLVLPTGAGGRLDAVLAKLDSGLSRRQLKEAFRAGRVQLAGRSVTGATAARPGVEVTILAAPVDDAPPVGDLPLTIVFADQALIVVEKPPGVPAYALSPAERDTVAGRVLARFPDLAGVGDLKLAPGLCHRLDLETSGLLLFARSAAAFAAVRQQFRNRQVDKGYEAVVAGTLRGEGVVDLALGRMRGERRRMVAVQEHLRLRKSWPARTRFRAVESGNETTLVELVLETGVTHQARVHMMSLGHPIVGDRLYGGPEAPRLLLHAKRLGLTHPGTGVHVTWESELGLRAP